MRWILVVCVVVGACGGPGTEMRPRGRRNSTRINALDDRISALEGRNDTVLSGGPTKPLEQRVHDLEDALRKTTARMQALEAELKQLHAAPVPAPAPAADGGAAPAP
jgi:hypothetical protein